MTICPNCKDGVAFTQTDPKTFKCKTCGFQIKISDDYERIYITLDGKEWLYKRDGWFESK